MKFKQKIKNFFIAHPMDDKSKGRIQGIALGFAVCAVGFLVMCLAIGCAPRDDEPKQSLSGQAQRHNLYGADSYVIEAGTYTFNSSLDFLPENQVFSFSFRCLTVGSAHYYMDLVSIATYGPSSTMTYGEEDENYLVYDASLGVWKDNDVFVSPREIVVASSQSVSSTFYNWFYANSSFGVVSSSSDSSASSDESSSSDSSSEPPAVGSIDNGFSVTLSETTAFSAWAKNPSNNEYATNYDSNAPFVLYTGSSSGGANTHITSAYNTYFVGKFSISGVPNRSFDTIGLVTLNLSVDNAFCLDGASEAVKVSADMYEKGAFIISECYYVDSATNTRLHVFSMGSQRATLNGSEITALVGPTWANQGFRNLDFVDGSRLIDVNGLSASARFQMENNSLSSSSATSTWVLGNSSTGVFGLIASAFGAIGGILGIALIPGLTIGTLLFIPLVVTIVLAIIKMMGK